MAILGKGTANGACSLLHAAGIGYGASLALDLPVIVRLLDKEPKSKLDDPDNLLESVIKVWREMKLPSAGPELYWTVKSKIPPRQGLKSSAAIAVAAIRALSKATDQELENHQIVDLAAKAQVDAGVSITGSIDDAWAATEGGWKLINVHAEDIQSGVIMEQAGPTSEDWRVFLLLRGEREIQTEPEDFSYHQQAFSQALAALQEGKEMVAITWNGRGVIGALNDPKGRRLTNDAFVNGARAAGISGSGSAIAIFAAAVSGPTCERLLKWYDKFPDVEIIETSIINAEIAEE